MRLSKFAGEAIVVMLVTIAFAFMSGPARANDVQCSDFGGIIGPGIHDYNIIVDTDCTVTGGATVNGNLVQPDPSAPWEIRISGNVDGTVENRGDGRVLITVGPGQRFNGNVKDEGDGSVFVVIFGGIYDGNLIDEGSAGLVSVVCGRFDTGGLFDGNIQEKDAGEVAISVGGGCQFNGNAMEGGDGGVFISLGDARFNGNLLESGGGDLLLGFLTSDYNGNVREEDDGECFVVGEIRGNKEGGCA